MNALEKLNAYEKQRDKEEGMTRRSEPLVKLTYKEGLDGLMYPEINEPKNNHTLSLMEQRIQQYLMTYQPNLYNELLLTQELMTVLPQMEAKYHSQVAKNFEALNQNEEPKEQPREREKQLNYLKTQAMELANSQLFPTN
ncbi:TPA: TnpV protein [Enterococcus faecalis]|uniref:TnpV protein n=2 Tax=Enterococcus faecalis TaxID=1351 RepID=UPI00296DF1CF|nr:TnpV protein [Enterococcus faecalis]HAP4515967.1 TnpV protein [Enterococcus faecalis]HAP4522789.1 TnpV protein [Enterococcus faecalis]HAP4552919.1 TnpV protein [Enterococcus faecalis]HAP4722812.1 TnpV protein [Enterococcus faecalis]